MSYISFCRTCSSINHISRVYKSIIDISTQSRHNSTVKNVDRLITQSTVRCVLSRAICCFLRYCLEDNVLSSENCGIFFFISPSRDIFLNF